MGAAGSMLLSRLWRTTGGVIVGMDQNVQGSMLTINWKGLVSEPVCLLAFIDRIKSFASEVNIFSSRYKMFVLKQDANFEPV